MEIPQDKYIQVGHVNIRYWAEGEKGSAIVFIHGIGGCVEAWLSSFTALSSNHRVYAMDLMGQGLSEKPLTISYKINEFSQFIKNFMGALKIEHAHIIGHSLGGAISTRLTIMQPNLVDKLVLVSSGGLGKSISTALRICTVPFLGEFFTRPNYSGTEQSLKALVADPAVITKEVVDLNYKMSSLPGAQQAFLRILRANINPLLGQISGANTHELGTIKNPVLVIWGKQDPTIPVTHANTAADHLPNVHIQVFDKCGHMPMLEHPQEFNALLKDFLE
jgi:4,5:9,10-diseco-3-hydroxy-5,9,17-trioxoandrosta-1(10),2-diene-4-oate hydrolase